MRIISNRSLKECWSKYPESRIGLAIWEEKIRFNEFDDHHELKKIFPDADYIPNPNFRHFTVFNIKGNKFRLGVDIIFNRQQVYVKWFGLHKNYDKIDFKSLANGGFTLC